MTRGDIKAAVRATAQAYFGTADEIDPILLNLWIDWTAEDICRGVDSLYLSISQDIVANQATYCLPDVFYIEACEIVLASALSKPIGILTTQRMSATYPWWRTSPDPSGEPRVCVTQGFGSLILYPTPNYGAAGGITLRGNGVISNALWPADNAICPLPQRMHQTVVNGTLVRCGEQKNKPELIAVYEKRYRNGLGHFESEMATFTESERNRTSGSSDYYVPHGPLDM